MVLVEQKSITKAADFLGLKQPTVSAALKRLEDVTGHRLIVRKPNHFKVTSAGEILYKECSSIFGSVSQLPSLIDRSEDELRGHITIVTASHVVCPQLDEALAEFARLHRNVTFAISVSDSREIVNQVSQNRVSFGICLMNKPLSNLNVQVMYREFFGLYCGPHHRLFGRNDIEISELEGEQGVSFQTEVEGGPLEPVSDLRRRVQAETQWQGVSSNLVEIRRMIVANVGIGALPVHVAQNDVKKGLLHQLPPYEDLPVVDVYLASNPKRRFSDAEREFSRLCKTHIFDKPMAERTFLQDQSPSGWAPIWP